MPKHSPKPDTNKEFCTKEALDLIEHLLVIDHTKRFTAEEALNHVFLEYEFIEELHQEN